MGYKKMDYGLWDMDYVKGKEEIKKLEIHNQSLRNLQSKLKQSNKQEIPSSLRFSERLILRQMEIRKDEIGDDKR